MRRPFLAALIPAALIVIVAGVALFALGWHNARADPVVRRTAVALPGWTAGEPPITVALLSDIHMESAAMDEPRLARIVAQVNALRPDLIVIAGDFVEGRGDHEAERALPLLSCALARLRAPLGTVAVLGNHDYWTDAEPLARMLATIGIVVLRNGATPVGPLALAGLDDQPTHHARLGRTLAALRKLRGAGVMLAHSPDVAPKLPATVTLLLAGHTHCGQVVLPLVGAPIEVAPSRYRCGIVREGARTTVVTAGLGTSNLPVRLGAPPDLWLVRLGPTAGR